MFSSNKCHIFTNSNLLEKTSDSIIKAAKTGDLVLVSTYSHTIIRHIPCNNRIHCQQLKELHMQGYSLLSIDATGQTALHHGSKHGHRDIVKYLISYAPNAIVNMVDNAR